MPGKVWVCCIGLAASLIACGASKPPPPPSPAPAVVVNLEGTESSGYSDSHETPPPALGAATAPVTIVALLAFSDAESAAVYRALRRLQDRLGERELRLVLVTPQTVGSDDSSLVMAGMLRQNHGDAAYFDFATRMFDTDPRAFGDTLKLALTVGREHAQQGHGPARAEPDNSEPIVQAEAEALNDAPDGVVPSLSVNGIRVFGRLPPAQLETLVATEYEAARTLARTGIAARAVYPERVASNAERVVRREAGAPEPASDADASALEPAPAAPPPPPAAAPQAVTASHILFSYQGALRASPQITRSKADAKAMATEVLGRLRRGALTFDEAVDRFSDEPGAAQRKGALGSFTRERMVKPFADAAFALAPDEISDVVETDFGFHIIWRQQ